ncbi:MAG: aldo/keto reductase [Candidatus Omnitrophica bacterium]|nr:aldo/keto reductase [Candidatus Omnitrophota bacterium]
MMLYHNLHRNDITVSRLGLGTVQFGLDYGFTKAKNQDEVDSILDTCRDRGLTLLDTARAYGDSEEKIGRYLLHIKSNPFVIATKFDLITEDINAREDRLHFFLHRSIEKSLGALQVLDALDLVLLHQAKDFIVQNPLFWRILESLKKKNLIKSFGLSLYDVEQALSLVSDHADLIDFVQIPFSVFDQRFKEIFQIFERNQIDVINRSVFLKGLIVCDPDDLPLELIDCRKFKQAFTDLATALNMSVAELALGYVLQEDNLSASLVGVNSVDELLSNIKVFSLIDSIKQNSINFERFALEESFLIDPRQWSQL